MAKKKKSKTPIDYHMAVFAVIPSTPEAYHRTTPDLVQRKDEAVGKSKGGGCNVQPNWVPRNPPNQPPRNRALNGQSELYKSRHQTEEATD